VYRGKSAQEHAKHKRKEAGTRANRRIKLEADGMAAEKDRGHNEHDGRDLIKAPH
jgi:hypothetical protein